MVFFSEMFPSPLYGMVGSLYNGLLNKIEDVTVHLSIFFNKKYTAIEHNAVIDENAHVSVSSTLLLLY